MVERDPDMIKKFRKVAKGLSYFDLHRVSHYDGKLRFSEGDIEGPPPAADGFFLGYYSLEGIKTVLKRYGVFDSLFQKGLDNFIVDLDFSDPFRQALRVYHDNTKSKETLLAELIVQEGAIKPKQGGARKEIFEVIHIHWLLLQNPTAEFGPKRPSFPNQLYPGLGIGRGVLEMLIIMAGRLHKDALLIYPEHFHNALLYRPSFLFYDAAAEGLVSKLDKTLGDRCLAEKAWLMYHECIVDNDTGDYLPWISHEQLMPINGDLKSFFNSKKYRLSRSNSEMLCDFSVDEAKLKLALEEEGPPLEWLLEQRGVSRRWR